MPFYILLFLGCSLGLTAQPLCSFDQHMQESYENNPMLRELINETEEKIRNSDYALPRNEIQIPVVIHLVWNQPNEIVSDDLVLSQIDALNRDFNKMNSDLSKVPDEFKDLVAAIGISFYLAEFTPTGDFTNGIIRTKTNSAFIGLSNDIFYSELGGSTAWDTEKYLNIWVCNLGDAITGYGTYPTLSIPEETGVVIDYKYFGINDHSLYGLGRVAVHEIGHFLGLKHPWGEDINCGSDDGITDTPLQENAYFGCPQHPQISCGSTDLFMSFMDYVQDPCMVMFTEGQKEWMLSTLSIYRSGLIQTNPNNGPSNDKKLTFKIYPNPSISRCTINFNNTQSKVFRYQIFNSNGQEIDVQEIFINKQLSIDISNYPRGVYFLKLDNHVEKLVKL